MKILFVCSSNVCRSPYAEFVFRRIVEHSPVLSKAGIEVSSSAVFNKSKTIFPKAVVSLKREGFSEEEILAFKPSFKWCNPEKFRDADVIIGMSRMHGVLTPLKYRKKFITLSRAATGKETPIPDPFLYKTQEEYDKVMSVIKVYLEKYAAVLESRLSEVTSDGHPEA